MKSTIIKSLLKQHNPTEQLLDSGLLLKYIPPTDTRPAQLILSRTGQDSPGKQETEKIHQTLIELARTAAKRKGTHIPAVKIKRTTGKEGNQNQVRFSWYPNPGVQLSLLSLTTEQQLTPPN